MKGVCCAPFSILKLFWNVGSAVYEGKDVQDYPDIAVKEPEKGYLIGIC
jgi:hypothetical protein